MWRIFLVITIAALFFVGCSNPVEPESTDGIIVDWNYYFGGWTGGTWEYLYVDVTIYHGEECRVIETGDSLFTLTLISQESQGDNTVFHFKRRGYYNPFGGIWITAKSYINNELKDQWDSEPITPGTPPVS